MVWFIAKGKYTTCSFWLFCDTIVYQSEMKMKREKLIIFRGFVAFQMNYSIYQKGSAVSKMIRIFTKITRKCNSILKRTECLPRVLNISQGNLSQHLCNGNSIVQRQEKRCPPWSQTNVIFLISISFFFLLAGTAHCSGSVINKR